MKDFPIALIHSDLHDENVLFLYDKKKIGAVIDWDDSHFGACVIDVGQSLVCWCVLSNREKGDKRYKLDPEMIKTFLADYQTARKNPLTTSEKGALWYCAMWTALDQIGFVEKFCKGSWSDLKSIVFFYREMVAQLEAMEVEFGKF